MVIVKAYEEEEKVSCKVSINEEFGRVCRVENLNHETMNILRIDGKSFKYVFFQNSNIKFFTSEFVEQLEGIEYLNVNEVGLERIDGRVFGRLNKLLVFWGSQNDIKTLDARTFSENKDLEFICLKFNKINYIHRDAFSGMTNLIKLDLSSNRLKKIENIFHSLYDLVALDLSSNQIETLDDEIFENLVNIRQLSLSKNNLKFLNAEAFDPLISLEFIDISFNKLSVITQRIFKYNYELKRIIFCGNKIRSIDERFFFNEKPQLELVLLRMNICTNDDLTAKNGTISKIELEKINLCFHNEINL